MILQCVRSACAQCVLRTAYKRSLRPSSLRWVGTMGTHGACFARDAARPAPPRPAPPLGVKNSTVRVRLREAEGHTQFERGARGREGEGSYSSQIPFDYVHIWRCLLPRGLAWPGLAWRGDIYIYTCASAPPCHVAYPAAGGTLLY